MELTVIDAKQNFLHFKHILLKSENDGYKTDSQENNARNDKSIPCQKFPKHLYSKLGMNLHHLPICIFYKLFVCYHMTNEGGGHTC